MKQIVGIIAGFALSATIALEEGRCDPGTPKQQYSALLKEYYPVAGGMRKATTDFERKAAVESIAAYPSKFMEIAEKYPKSHTRW